MKKSEQAVIELEEKRRVAQEEAAALVRAKEEAESKRIEVEELARKNELEKEQMVCIPVSTSPYPLNISGLKWHKVCMVKQPCGHLPFLTEKQTETPLKLLNKSLLGRRFRDF